MDPAYPFGVTKAERVRAGWRARTRFILPNIFFSLSGWIPFSALLGLSNSTHQLRCDRPRCPLSVGSVHDTEHFLGEAWCTGSKNTVPVAPADLPGRWMASRRRRQSDTVRECPGLGFTGRFLAVAVGEGRVEEGIRCTALSSTPTPSGISRCAAAQTQLEIEMSQPDPLDLTECNLSSFVRS